MIQLIIINNILIIFFRYKDNPYHNKIHSFDVTQTINFYVTKCNFGELANLTPFELAAMYIAAAIHDF